MAPAPTAEFSVDAQKVQAVLCLIVVLSVQYVLPGKCHSFKIVSPFLKHILCFECRSNSRHF